MIYDSFLTKDSLMKKRQYLTEDEIKAIMTHKFTDKKLAYIRDLFVFAKFHNLAICGYQRTDHR